jgi:hypothetical protein
MNPELERVFGSLPLFSANFLQILSKSGQKKHLDFNNAQGYLHERLEAQLKATGKVRALCLKGRQQGVSTYIQARYFHKVVTSTGKKAFILTHDAEATKNLFNMTKRFYDNCPTGLIAKADLSNAKELFFKTLDSGYSIGTAGNKAVGRGQTVQLMHASEIAYYTNAEDHATGIFQAVSNEDETEIIMESTANGIGNYFYNMWMSAMSGKSEFQAVFIPWFWQPEYKSQQREGENSLSDEEQYLLSQYEHDGLTTEHLYWRRRKLHEFSNDYETSVEKFNTEYPFTALEAFRNPIENRFIRADIVKRAQKNNIDASMSPLIIGCDPAISDNDFTAIIRRKGRVAYGLELHHNLNTMEIAGALKRIIDKERPAKVAIDIIGVGSGVHDRLKEMGYECVEGVNVARSANDKEKFKNQRAELWHDMREWLAGELPVQIPEGDIMLGDLTSLGYKYDSSGRLQIESKEDLRNRGMKSPDSADALAMTFVVGEYLHAGAYKPEYISDKAQGMFI